MAAIDTPPSSRPSAPGTGAPVPAVTKTIAIIRRLNAGPSVGLGLSDISGDLGLTKSHCHNILKTLVAEGWVTFDTSRRRYALAPRLLADISRVVARQDRSSLLHEELVRLSMSARIPCVLSRIEPDDCFIAIDKAEEAAELLVSVPIGHRFPSDAPAQMRARLAFSPPELRERLLADWSPVAYTPTTITDKDEMREELRITAERGYAISREEYSPGVTSFAVPIFNASGEVQMILQCPGLGSIMSAREDKITGALKATADRINQVFMHV
jgi:DNA-binding IclR family transcriptional regulator